MVKCVLLGATRGCGLETLLNLVDMGHSCYVLARNEAAFSKTLAARSAKTDLITVVQGDAFSEQDVGRLFSTAGDGVGFALFSLGGRPSFKNPLSPKLEPPQICSRTINVFLPVFTRLYPDPSNQPRLVVISSSGIGPKGHKELPFAMKPMYSWLLKEPHADKEDMERLVNSYAGIQHVDFNPTPGEVKLGNVVIVRPSLLVDGPVKGKVRAGESLEGAWTVQRSDVGRFIAVECGPGVDTWRNKGIVVSN
ncbi:uncharacterized protein H6S33_001979 [Morchella sextelata]|uniref:uncharacterized protein n=1 Tax=Morchella sextelata TaxID=1174677 RepID=UPI001D0536A2|nr:uncharacterized protein H6S33_001979 [Morchella sextelata]KAH0607927.1 hypothetical protein H6S33_001979 [Morchella sextelata]